MTNVFVQRQSHKPIVPQLKWCHETQHDDIHVMTLSIKGVYVTLSVTMFCHYAECRVLFIVILNVVRLIVFSLNVVAPIISQMEIFLVPVPLLGAMTLSIMALSITTFSIMTLCIKGLCITLSINDTQHNDALP